MLELSEEWCFPTHSRQCAIQNWGLLPGGIIAGRLQPGNALIVSD
jgi:hypothetical protein